MKETLDSYSLLQSMSKRPAMYVGTMSLRALGHYIAGYCDALRTIGGSEELLGFTIWVQERYLICHSAWHWTRILLHVFGGDEAAIQALPELFLEYQRTKKGNAWKNSLPNVTKQSWQPMARIGMNLSRPTHLFDRGVASLNREAVSSQSPGLPLRLPWVHGISNESTTTCCAC